MSNKYWFVNIVAMADNSVIGNEGKLPWRIRTELQEFKKAIREYDLVMGRTTCESLPRPQNKGRQFVLTRDKNFHREGFINVHSIEDLLSHMEKGTPTYVIGGSSIYEQFIMLGERDDVLLTNEVTILDNKVEGDARFPIDLLGSYGYKASRMYRSGEGDYKWTKYLYYK